MPFFLQTSLAEYWKQTIQVLSLSFPFFFLQHSDVSEFCVWPWEILKSSNWSKSSCTVGVWETPFKTIWVSYKHIKIKKQQLTLANYTWLHTDMFRMSEETSWLPSYSFALTALIQSLVFMVIKLSRSSSHPSPSLLHSRYAQSSHPSVYLTNFSSQPKSVF